MNCRICHNENLKLFLSLGYHPPSDAFLSNLTEPETHYPLTVYECARCGLFQLGHVVPKEILYNDKYPYETGMNVEGVKHFRELAESVVKQFHLGHNDLVVDIGSNDGTLLSGFKESGCKVLGIEPVKQLAEKSKEKGIDTYSWFFSSLMPEPLFIGKAKIITATNVFAHVDDLHDFMKGIDKLLADNGIFIIEAPYIGDLLENFEFDTIYHEHLSYFSPKALHNLFKQFGMVIFKIDKFPIHGGTYRYYVCKKPYSEMFKTNLGNGLGYHPDKSICSAFVEKIEKNREELIWLLRSIKMKGKRIVGVSAPAKGNTLLNYCKIGPETLDYITEKSALKIGRFTPGMHIPIMPDERLLLDMPDYSLILAWNWSGQIMNNLKAYTEKGGKWIVPIPEPHIIRTGAGAWVPIEGL